MLAAVSCFRTQLAEANAAPAAHAAVNRFADDTCYNLRHPTKTASDALDQVSALVRHLVARMLLTAVFWAAPSPERLSVIGRTGTV
jgi:hypothetical protein